MEQINMLNYNTMQTFRIKEITLIITVLNLVLRIDERKRTKSIVYQIKNSESEYEEYCKYVRREMNNTIKRII